jgi:predicted ATPase
MAQRLRLLGTPALERDGEILPLPFERRTQLLAYLAQRRGWVGRAELAALFWGEQPERLASANLRKALFRMRALPWAPAVETHGGALRFEAASDVADFEEAVREGRHAEAVKLYRGGLLAGYDDEASEPWTQWLAFERERLRSLWRGAALAHLAADASGREAIALAERLLEADPLDEPALRAQVACLAKDGQAGEALAAYRRFASRLRAELGIEPSADLEALHDALGEAPARAFPSTPALQPPGDGFVGRSVELRQLAALLSQGDCRLVTLLGPGGVGKTRLARRAAAELAARYEAAFFVPLEEAAGGTDIAAAIATATGIALASRRDPWGEVARALATRRLLLVLDNFEHLAAEAPRVGQLLAACPGIEMVVTSRARLGLPMEQLLPLDGLPVPDAEDQDRFDAFDAVRLFVKAARRVEPALVPDAEAAAIVDICRQVDGLPLAIELAASWVRVLSCEAIAAQLREGLLLLRSADAAWPARHASMEVVFDQSWRLLGATERAALARLAVFEGGFSAESAHVVAGASLPVLAALMDKSLLRKEHDRLHLHPLVHQLAAARLAQDDPEGEARHDHARHFHRWVAQLRGPVTQGDPDAMRTLDRECSNCRAAWRWAASHGPPAALRGSLFTLLHFCDHRFRLEEGLALMQEALGEAATTQDAKLARLLRAAASHLLYRLDRYPEAEREARAAMDATGGEGEAETRFQCLKVLGGCALRTGALDAARRWFAEALALAPESGDPQSAAGMLDNLAIVEKRLGNYDEALSLSQQSLLQHRLGRDFAGEALTLNNLGTLCFDRGEYAASRARLQESLALCERHGLANTRAMALVNLLELEMVEGSLEAAERHGRESLPIARATGARSVEAAARIHLAQLAVRRGDLASARLELGLGLELAAAIGNRSLQYTGLRCHAELLIATGARAQGRALLALCIAQPDIGASDRDAMRALLGDDPAPAWTGPDLQELLHRLVVEREAAQSRQANAPLSA